jgi:type IV secretion system protein VirB1
MVMAMDATLFLALATACAPQVATETAHALVAVESGFNPHAIGVVGGALLRQPQHRAEALATAKALQADGWDFSLGLAQINSRNFQHLGLSIDSAFDPCTNLTAMQTILGECFDRALPRKAGEWQVQQRALRQALSCYYSGNFVTGFSHGYVRRVVAATAQPLPMSVTSKESP